MPKASSNLLDKVVSGSNQFASKRENFEGWLIKTLGNDGPSAIVEAIRTKKTTIPKVARWLVSDYSPEYPMESIDRLLRRMVNNAK